MLDFENETGTSVLIGMLACPSPGRGAVGSAVQLPINRIFKMTSVPRLVNFWESMSETPPVVNHPGRRGALNHGCSGHGPSGCETMRLMGIRTPGGQPPEQPCPSRGTGLERKSSLHLPVTKGCHPCSEDVKDSCRLASAGNIAPESGFGSKPDYHNIPENTQKYPIPSLEVLVYEAELFEVLGSETEIENDAVSDSNMFAALSDNDGESCTRSRGLCGKARTLVRFFKSLGHVPISEPPESIVCGELRQSVRNCFGKLDALAELSFKTVAKVEKNCCSNCLPRFEARLDDWIDERYVPVDVDFDHVARFKECVRRNVQKGWDDFRRPFIPNGHATLNHGRKKGGNWNREEFSEYCTPCLVFSSGKPRVVTKYSSWNTSVLGELHYSLYTCLKRKRWLLVGDPTDQHIQRLKGADLLSFDYKSATDNIKAEYVRAAVQVLKEQATGLSGDEVRALDTLANLKLDGRGLATRGQPMGSVMSFPLLCLINKSIVDLALTRMLEGKEISFSEWSSHRCLINGDDLLTREVRSNTNLRGLISEEGNKVGLTVNEEKTMSSPSLAEINSTLFSDGIKQRKFNASALWMDSDVQDVLGFAAQACPDARSFSRVVRANANILAKQPDKRLDVLPFGLQRVCAKDRVIRRALVSLPNDTRRTEEGPIRMERVPEDYALDRDDEYRAMRDEIERVRDRAIAFFSRPARSFHTTIRSNACSYRSVRKRRRERGQEVLPSCYIRCFREKKWKSLAEEGVATFQFSAPVLDESKANYLIGLLRSRKREDAVRTPLTDDLLSNRDFVSFGCDQQP